MLGTPIVHTTTRGKGSHRIADKNGRRMKHVGDFWGKEKNRVGKTCERFSRVSDMDDQNKWILAVSEYDARMEFRTGR
jgi:hypothetical protein